MLTAKHQYTVTVSGVTAAGEGEQSSGVILESEGENFCIVCMNCY